MFFTHLLHTQLAERFTLFTSFIPKMAKEDHSLMKLIVVSIRFGYRLRFARKQIKLNRQHRNTRKTIRKYDTKR